MTTVRALRSLHTADHPCPDDKPKEQREENRTRMRTGERARERARDGKRESRVYDIRLKTVQMIHSVHRVYTHARVHVYVRIPPLDRPVLAPIVRPYRTRVSNKFSIGKINPMAKERIGRLASYIHIYTYFDRYLTDFDERLEQNFSNKAAMIKPAGEKTKTHDSRFRANRARESRPRAVPRTGIVVRERKCRVAFDSTARFELGDLGPTIDLDSYTLPRRYAATSILLLLHLLSTRPFVSFSPSIPAYVQPRFDHHFVQT